MFLLLLVIVEVYFFFRLANIYTGSFFLLVYGLWYFDGKEYSGERRWDWVRRFRLWNWLSPVEYTFANAKDLCLFNANTKRIYILLPADTLIPLVWGIGLHGGRLSGKFSERLHYIVPPVYMWVPLLRDVLMWTGAVTYHPTRKPLNDIVLELLQHSRSIVYCPSHLGNILYDTGGAGEEDIEAPPVPGESAIETPCPSDELLSFARAEQIQMVPVVVQGERQRYYMLTHRFLLKRVQTFFFDRIGYPFPFVFCFKLFSRTKPPKLQQQFGAIMHCDAKYPSNQVLKESFKECVRALQCRELGDNTLKLL